MSLKKLEQDNLERTEKLINQLNRNISNVQKAIKRNQEEYQQLAATAKRLSEDLAAAMEYYDDLEKAQTD